MRKDPNDPGPLGELIEQYADELAYMLTHVDNSESTVMLQYCLREIIRNAYDHGKQNQIWVCAQYWPSRNEAEIALLNERRGIWAELRKNDALS